MAGPGFRRYYPRFPVFSLHLMHVQLIPAHLQTTRRSAPAVGKLKKAARRRACKKLNYISRGNLSAAITPMPDITGILFTFHFNLFRLFTQHFYCHISIIVPLHNLFLSFLCNVHIHERSDGNKVPGPGEKSPGRGNMVQSS